MASYYAAGPVTGKPTTWPLVISDNNFKLVKNLNNILVQIQSLQSSQWKGKKVDQRSIDTNFTEMTNIVNSLLNDLSATGETKMTNKILHQRLIAGIQNGKAMLEGDTDEVLSPLNTLISELETFATKVLYPNVILDEHSAKFDEFSRQLYQAQLDRRT